MSGEQSVNYFHDVTISRHQRGERAYIKIVLWGMSGGRYASERVLVVQLEDASPPQDREELAALALRALARIAYDQ